MESYTNPEYTKDVAVTVGKVSATFKVEVLAAEEYKQHGRQPELKPTLRITTHRTHDDADAVIIRKRAYTMDVVQQPEPGYDYRLNKPTGTTVWRSSARDHHDRGVRNDAGAMVEYSTATRKQLDELAAAARDRFIAENPGWELASRERRLLALIKRAEGQAEGARREAAKHDEDAAKLRAELAALELPRAYQQGVSTVESASKLRSGDRVLVTGVDADGARRQASGYVLIADKMASGGYAVTVTQNADGTGPTGTTVYVLP